MLLIHCEHLSARPETETEFGNRGRGLEPTSRWRRADHIAEPINDVEMYGVAFRLAEPAHCRLAGAAGADRIPIPPRHPCLQYLPVAGDSARPLLKRRAIGDKSLALSVVGVRQQDLDWDRHEVGIAVKGIAVRKGKLRGLDLPMDKIGCRRVKALELKTFQSRELLKCD